MSQTWHDNIQNVYNDFEEFLSYNDVFSIVTRCGYSDPLKLWSDNPVIGGSANPADFGLYKPVLNTYRLTGTRQKINAIGEHEKFVNLATVLTPKEAMNLSREIMYAEGWNHILHTRVEIRQPLGSPKLWVEIPMMKALELE